MRWPKPSAAAIFAILMVLSFLALFLPAGWANPLRAAVNSLTAPSAAGMNQLLAYFRLAQPPAEHISPEQYQKLRDRLLQLQRQNIILHQQWMDAENKYARAQHLSRNLLLKEYSLIPANVYGHAPPGKAILRIDQGSTVGLKVGMWVVGFPERTPPPPGRAVLESSVLLGQLGSVQARTAQVSLLGDPDRPPLSASLYRRKPGSEDFEESGGPDLHVQPLPGGKLIARDVPKQGSLDSDEDLQDLVGALVVSKPGKNLPAGLAFGRVVQAEISPRSIAFLDLTIEPLAKGVTFSSAMVLCPTDNDK